MTVERSRIEEFIYTTCMLMDERDFSGFMALCDPEFRYRLSAYSPEIHKEMTWLDRDRKEFEEFLLKMLPKHNSDRSPLTRNAIVYKVEMNGSTAKVTSALQIFKTQLDGGATSLFAVGKYVDTVAVEGDELRLKERWVKLDTRDLGWGYHVPF
ncbi:aromatic-ring-hydroxylating dioxygenase subunit beta [Pelomicrobium sp.]|jgi:methanesulfonate monooxygenase small subunit|uniref:aromatic-ring-hydroxylating dioxygenase subunit beta n=1 Tax=Pelomicrobium sp. TaxID=2815319 RepID=UPI002FDCD766